MILFLNSEVHNSGIDMHCSRKAQWIIIGTLFKPIADSIYLRHSPEFSGWSNVTYLRHAKSNEIDKPFGNQGNVLRWTRQFLMSGLRGNGLLPHHAIPMELFQIEHIFEKEQP